MIWKLSIIVCLSACLSLRRPGPVYRGAKAAEGLFEADKETKQRTKRDAEETPQEGTVMLFFFHLCVETNCKKVDYVYHLRLFACYKTNCLYVFVGVDSE